MNNAELYQRSNTLQKRDALDCLEEYKKKLNWKNYETVIDIGCGDGSVTTGILRKFLPNDFKQLIGCDISDKMIDYANMKHTSDYVKFIVMDIAGNLPDDMKGVFNHAFSFYTLHWIKQQEVTFRNIFKLLAEGGDCLLVFLGHMPVFDVYRILARSHRWRYWLKDVDKFISPYHDSQDPEKEIRRMMCKIGFSSVEVQCRAKSFIYNGLDALKRAVKAVNPFNLPEDCLDEFLEDYVSVVRDMKLIENDDNVESSVKVNTNYNLITVYGVKRTTLIT
ncbi:juvenile hormone acid O-methyltransferase [Leptidea sinapis]|uniref:juvenile hormone acid O-methyltransferase n=1 Tax=Leptidea sinapis TaxID=189913 RepID=UPI00213C47A3|nr:juvenile hormone acid O-methyltransferase [Leptidea sinapis]XP_050664955.1 juvenile hormone acid O-methyltransferase [Leptidea sinapis]